MERTREGTRRERVRRAGLAVLGALAVLVGLVGLGSGATEAASSGGTAAGSALGQEGGGRILAEVPEEIDPGARYLFYLHGRIIEDAGERPTHPTFGVYEYRQILAELAAGGFTVISERRPPATDMDGYAARVVRQVETLLRAGVPPQAISVVGFSKGAGIAERTSSQLGNDRVSFVLLGSCGGSGPDPKIRLSGRILAIYEASDEISGPCTALFAQALHLEDACEIKISTGQRHGAFYRPLEEWIGPVLDWCAG